MSNYPDNMDWAAFDRAYPPETPATAYELAWNDIKTAIEAALKKHDVNERPCKYSFIELVEETYGESFYE